MMRILLYYFSIRYAINTIIIIIQYYTGHALAG